MRETDLFQTFVAAADAGNLTAVLREYIERYKAYTGASSVELMKRLGESAGIHESTVYAIARGEIKRPPDHRLWGFAQVLSGSEEAKGTSANSNVHDVTESRPASFENVWTHIQTMIGDRLELRSFLQDGSYRFHRSEEAIVVVSTAGSKSLPKAWFENAWRLLESRGILFTSDLPSNLQDAAEILVLFGNLPYIDYSVNKSLAGNTSKFKLSLFLTDHIFTNGQLSDVFSVSNSGGIRYSGKADNPQLIVFISGGVGSKSSIPYRDRWEGDRFHYTGEGLRGDQALTRGNLALKSSIENRCPIYGFEKLGPDRYRYLGRFKVVEISEEVQTDVDGNNRRTYVFQMERLSQKTVMQLSLTEFKDREAQVEERVTSAASDSLRPLAAKDYKVAALLADWDWSDQMQALIARVLETGFFFEPWEIVAYVTALRTKPFVILAGISGTGKSKLPQLVARACGYSAELIPVRPDWTDSSDLLGYIDLAGRFRPGRLLQLARQAEANLDRGFVVVLDEMNLARVEHYFAEVLSRIEERFVSGTSWFCNPLVQSNGYKADSLADWANVGLPPNLAIVGTVNMDESTHGFSRKVLDRAFTLELSDAKLDRWGRTSAGSALPAGAEARRDSGGQLDHVDATGSLNWPAAAMIPERTTLAEVNTLTAAEQETIEQVISHLQRLNEELKAAQLQVGYRVRDEVALFVVNAMSVADGFVTTDGERVDPLDLAVSMKVLPRIIGGSNAIRRVLTGVLAWATGRRSLDDRDVDRLVDQWRDQGRPSSMSDYPFPRCAARLCLMWERLFDEGFTSYWL